MKKNTLISISLLAIGLILPLAVYAIAWPNDIILVGNATLPNYEPSGLAWYPGTNKLFTVSDGGFVTKMDLNGGNQQTYTPRNIPGANLPGTDFEAITIKDPATNLVYIGVERPDSIFEFDFTPDLTKPDGIKGFAGKSWDLTDTLYGGSVDGNQGLEGLAFVPNGYHPYGVKNSGGVFYAAVQRSANTQDVDPKNDFLIYAFDVDLNNSGSKVWLGGIPVPPNTPNENVSDLFFNKDTGILYVLYDDSANRLIEMKLETTANGPAWTILNDYSGMPTVSAREGLAVVTTYPNRTATLYVASDSNTPRSINWFSGYPVTYYDADSDGVDYIADCNDNDITILGKNTYYQDHDGDGLGNANVSVLACSAPNDGHVYVLNSNDTNDNDSDNDGSEKGVDCNDNDISVSSIQTFYADIDGDGLGTIKETVQVCSSTPPAGYVNNSNDLNENDLDNDSIVTAKDCNDRDSAILGKTTYYRDDDGDGLGSTKTASVSACSVPNDGFTYVLNANDANDNDFDNDGSEKGVDCNDNDRSLSAYSFYFKDPDGDGKGSGKSEQFCSAIMPAGYSANNLDLFENDFDNDGLTTSLDCNDRDAVIRGPKTYYQDSDGDGLGSAGVSISACSIPAGYVDNQKDLNDRDFDNDGVSTDVDCNDRDVRISSSKRYYADPDGDKMGSGNGELFCSVFPPAGYVDNNNDLFENDFDNDGVPTAQDCNDRDVNIKGKITYYTDNDRDGLGSDISIKICGSLAGHVLNSDDNNDSDFDNDGISTANDCDDHNANVRGKTAYYKDNDRDGLGSIKFIIMACSAPAGYVLNSNDRNDNDFDNDGSSTGVDCNDTNSLYYQIRIYFLDKDGDGLGSKTSYKKFCVPPPNYVSNNNDNDDRR